MNHATHTAFLDELEKIGSLTLGIGGALLGGKAGEIASKKLLKGRYAGPLILGGSLGGSMAAQNVYYGRKNKKLLKGMSASQKRALAKNLEERNDLLRRAAGK